MGTHLIAHNSRAHKSRGTQLKCTGLKSQRMHSITQSSFEMLTHQIDVLKELTRDGACVVVEGKRDEATLRDLGIDAIFYHVSGSGESIQKLAEKVSKEKEAIILTDFDRKGRILASKVVEKLNHTAKKTKINLQVRRKFLQAMQKTKVGEIEDLASLIENQKGDDIPWEK